MSAVISRALLLASVVSCALCVVSFGLFAYDQVAGADQNQLATLRGQQAVHRGGPPSHKSQPRRLIDGAARALTSPFRSLVQSDSKWAVWISSTVMALLVYGLGLGFLARMARL
jgi:hypothetical protein